MSSSTRFFAVLLLMLLCIPASLYAQTTPKPAAKIPRGSVSGRVTIKDKPAPGVTVGLRVNSGMVPFEKFYKAVTDQEGVYHITNVPAGTYEIAPSAPAYVVGEGNAPRGGKSVIVGEDEDIENINFSLIRGAVITGKITDADGRPLVQQQVYLYRAADFLQQPLRQIYSAASVSTDDRGIYRFFGLAAGRYKVACGRGDETYAVNYYMPSRIIYRQVFFPDATDQAKATLVDAREGNEIQNIDIALGAPIETFTLTGRVIDGEKGTPVPNVRFGMQRRSGESFQYVESGAVSNIKGDFIVEGLVPGKYGIMLLGGENQEMRAESVTVDIVDGDVSGVTVRLMKASTISGVVVLEPEDKKAFAKLRELELRGYVTSGGAGAGQSTVSSIGPDGSFRLPGLTTGQVNLWLTAQMGMERPKGFTVTRVEHNGVSQPRGIEIKDGDQLTGVRVVVSYGTASLKGVVKLENGPLPEGGRMFIRVTKPGTPPTPIGSMMVDARGQFLLEGIPAGVYEVSVMAYAPSMKSQPTSKREVSVQDGVVNEVSLTLDLTPQLQPVPPPKP